MRISSPRKKRSVGIVSCICLFAWIPVLSDAAIIQYEARGILTNSGFAPAIIAGDPFVCSFEYNDGVRDTDARTTTAVFNGAITACSLHLGSGALGNLEGVSASAPLTLSVSRISDNVPSIYFSTNNFGPVNGTNVSLLLQLLGRKNSSSFRDFGSGQTLASVMPTPIVLADYPSAYLYVGGRANGPLTNVQVVGVVPDLIASFSSEGRVQIRWTTNAVGFALETNDGLPQTEWTGVTNEPQINVDHYSVEVDATSQSAFYRLKR